jgi:hypothetical protein
MRLEKDEIQDGAGVKRVWGGSDGPAFVSLRRDRFGQSAFAKA